MSLAKLRTHTHTHNVQYKNLTLRVNKQMKINKQLMLINTAPSSSRELVKCMYAVETEQLLRPLLTIPNGNFPV